MSDSIKLQSSHEPPKDGEEAVLQTPTAVEQQQTIYRVQKYALASLRSSDYFITFVIGFCMLVQSAVYQLYTPIIPFQLENTGVTDVGTYTGYVASGFAGGLCVAAPLFGHLGKRYKKYRRALLVALMVLTAASDILGVTISGFISMLMARIIQGISTTGVWVLAVSLMMENINEARAGMLMAWALLLYSIGNLAAQALAGTMYTNLGWKSVGFAGIILCALNALLLMLYLEKSQISLSESAHTGQRSESDAPITAEISHWAQLRLLASNSRLVVPLFVMAAYGIYVSGMLTTALAIRLADRYGLDAAQTSLAFLAISVPAAISGPPAGWLTDKFGARISLIICLVIYTISLALACIDALPLWAFLLVLVGIGIAQGIIVTPLLCYLAAADKIEKVQLGTSFLYAMWNFVYSIAFLAFPFVAGAIISAMGISRGWKVITGMTAVGTAVALGLTVKYVTVLPLPSGVADDTTDDKIEV